MGNEKLTNKQSKMIRWIRRVNIILFVVYSRTVFKILSAFNKTLQMGTSDKLLFFAIIETVLIVMMIIGDLSMENSIRIQEI